MLQLIKIAARARNCLAAIRMFLMKRDLLPASGNFYKANLHCHSTVSDGALTPEALKELYTKNGYSVIAFTDHT